MRNSETPKGLVKIHSITSDKQRSNKQQPELNEEIKAYEGEQYAIYQPTIPKEITADQNCIGFALGTIIDAKPGQHFKTFERAIEWFYSQFNYSNIAGGYRILYWPLWGEYQDGHWAAEMGNGHWVEKRGPEDIYEWKDMDSMLTNVGTLYFEGRRIYSTKVLIAFCSRKVSWNI